MQTSDLLAAAQVKPPMQVPLLRKPAACQSGVICLFLWSLVLPSEYGGQFQISLRLQTRLLRLQTNNDPWTRGEGCPLQPLRQQDARAK